MIPEKQITQGFVTSKQSLQGTIAAKQSLQGNAKDGNHMAGSITIGRPLATIKVNEIEGGHKITVIDPSGVQELNIMDGVDGIDGYTPVKGVDYFDGKDGENGADGKDGQDGTSPIISVAAITGGHRIMITDKNGTKSVDVLDGQEGKAGSDGADGQDGADGVGIASIEQTTISTADDGNNVITITLTNGQTATFTVQNGSKGSIGPAGKDGSDATVTAANIKTALNYTPAKQTDVDNLSKEVVDQKEALSDYALKSEIPTIPVESVNGKIGVVVLDAEDVGADPARTAETKVSEHNISTAAHNDIRLLIEGLTTRLNALANSDDITLDQMAEVVAYIKSNRTLIESITTDKISVADIVNNLTTNVSNKPLSAAQGAVLKGLIDALQTAVSGIKVPTKTSELTNDSGFLTQHQSLADYAKKTELPTKTSQLTNDSGFLTQHQDLSAYAKKTDIPSVPTKTSQLTNDSGFLTSIPSEYITETELNAKGYLTEHQDLSAYAKKSELPSVPTKTSQLTNDSGFLTSVPSEYVTETELNAKGYLTQHQDLTPYAKNEDLNKHKNDDTVHITQQERTAWNNKSNFSGSYNDLTNKPTIPSTPEQVGADPKGTATTQVGTHNTNTSAHNDIRLLIEGLTSRFNALANSTDEDLDQMAEIVAYIKSNKSLIESITTSKVNVTDIINNLTTNVANKPLSASQGVVLKKLIDDLQLAISDVSGTVEITSGNPTKNGTVLTINPDGEEVNIYEAEEVDEMIENLSKEIDNLKESENGGNSGNGATEEQLKQIEQNKQNISQLSKEVDDLQGIPNIAYGTCDTVAGTAEKVITIEDENWELKVGSIVMVYFSVTNSASNVKLNVNNTGAYPIWYNNAEYTSTGTAYTGYAKRVIGYMFNGTHWVWIMQSYDANTTYKNVALGHGYATCTTAEATTAKVGTLSSYTLTVGGIVAVKFTYGVPAGATLNINSKGAKAIYFRGVAITANVIKAGDTATFIYNGSQYHLLSIDRWQNDIDSLSNNVSHLSNEIVDQQKQLEGKQPMGNYLTEVPSNYVTDDELEAEMSALEAKMSQMSLNFAEGNTVAEALAWLEENGDPSLWYVLPDGYFYHCVEKETQGSTVPNFTNILETASVQLNKRYNSSNALKDLNGYIAIDYYEAKQGDVFRFKPSTLADDTSRANMYARLRCYTSGTSLLGNSDANIPLEYGEHITVENGVLALTIPYGNTAKVRMNLWVSDSAITSLDYDNCIVTKNEEITYTTTAGVTEKVWESTGKPLVATQYDEQINELRQTSAEHNSRLTALENSGGLVGMEVYAPSPQLPADGSSTADFNADPDVITANQIYDYLEPLLTKYSRYITKELMGKDASGNYDWNRYTLSRRGYDAWLTPNYPKMYAWTNGSTTIYSKSVSPRIGDTLYTTKYIGTSKGTVTAVSNANQTRTVGGVVYTRDKSKDIEPTLVYTLTKYSPYFNTVQHNVIYNSNKAKVSTISTYGIGTMTSAAGVTYTRYPLGDRTSNFEKLPVIVIGSNEHGTGGDPAEPAIISARMIKDLCECRQMDNAFLNLLKNNYMIVFCPVINPWGFSAPNKSYFNSNKVNLDRNLDTPGWGNDSASGGQGAYGGSEVEMQYFMNTIVESGAKIVIANHGVGEQTNSTTGEGISAGLCHWMLGRDNSKYTSYLTSIGEVMNVNYNLAFSDYGQAPPENHAKTRSYIDWVGAEGGAVEMQPRDGFITAGEGDLHTARIMEANYTLHLQFLHMLLACQES